MFLIFVIYPILIGVFLAPEKLPILNLIWRGVYVVMAQGYLRQLPSKVKPRIYMLAL